MSGGSIVGSFGPHQAFAIGGVYSVRGYGEGAIGCGQSCLISKAELAFPLVYTMLINIISNIIIVNTTIINWCRTYSIFVEQESYKYFFP